MAGPPDLPEIPASLKGIQHYLKVASMHDQRDPVVSYWCRLYAVQKGLKVSPKTAEETNFLSKLVEWLEATKKELHDNEAITNDVAAQAHLENWALKLFLYADKNDRAGNFSKRVVQSFFTAGLLYDVLTEFDELSEEATQNRKYAKWKAAYIHNCVKNGETPVPGPVREADENIDPGEDPIDGYADMSHGTKPERGTTVPDSDDSMPTGIDPYDAAHTPSMAGESRASEPEEYPRTEGGVELSPEQTGKAQKFIKWAGSALNYDDVPTAVLNLRKALHLLTTGQDPA